MVPSISILTRAIKAGIKKYPGLVSVFFLHALNTHYIEWMGLLDIAGSFLIAYIPRLYSMPTYWKQYVERAILLSIADKGERNPSEIIGHSVYVIIIVLE